MNENFCSSRLGQKFNFSSSFFGRIEDTRDISKFTDLYELGSKILIHCRAVVRGGAGNWGFRKENRKRNGQSITISIPRFENLINDSSV